MAENIKKKTNKLKVAKPSFWVYVLPASLVRLFTKIWWRHTIDNRATKHFKSPFLVIGNHSSTIDIVCSIHAILPKRLNVVASRDLFTWGALKGGIKAFGCIPKSQCAVDINSLRIMKRAVEQKRNIMLYPEGKTTMDGRNLYYISPSIAKLIKFLDVPVVFIKTNGGFLTKPRYYHGFRRAKVHTVTSVLLTLEEVRSLSAEQIYARVSEAMKFNDNVWQRENKVIVESKHLANNLNYILYKCPKCGAEYEMTADDHYLTCAHCGNKVEYRSDGFIVPADKDSVAIDSIDTWFDFERKAALEEISDDSFAISKEVTLSTEDHATAKFTPRGEGKLTLNNKVIRFEGVMDGEKTVIEQEITLMSTIITKNEEGIDLIVNDNIYRFLFVEHKWSSKYGLLVEMNFARNNNINVF